MSYTLLINIFAWSILGCLLPSCQIVKHFDVLLFYGIVMNCFGQWFYGFMRYYFLVCGILQLLQVGTCWAKDWGVVMKNPGEMYCWNDQITRFMTRIRDQSRVLLWFWNSSRNYRGPYCVFGGLERTPVSYFDACLSR